MLYLHLRLPNWNCPDHETWRSFYAICFFLTVYTERSFPSSELSESGLFGYILVWNLKNIILFKKVHCESSTTVYTTYHSGKLIIYWRCYWRKLLKACTSSHFCIFSLYALRRGGSWLSQNAFIISYSYERLFRGSSHIWWWFCSTLFGCFARGFFSNL